MRHRTAVCANRKITAVLSAFLPSTQSEENVSGRGVTQCCQALRGTQRHPHTDTLTSRKLLISRKTH